MANNYLFHQNYNLNQIASVIEESCPKDLQSNLQVKSARNKLSSLRIMCFSFFFFSCNYKPWLFQRKSGNTSGCYLTCIFLRVVFEQFDVHLSLIYKKILQHKTNETKQGEFINNVSNIKKKLLVVFSKESDMSWVTMWLSILSGVNTWHRECYLIIEQNCVSLSKYIYLTRTIFS